MEKTHNSKDTKPIVYIDLIGTLGVWVQPPTALSTGTGTAFGELNKTPNPYTEEMEIFSGIGMGVEPQTTSETQSHTTKRIALLENYKEVLKELRQNCQLKLISTANRIQTLEINNNFNLGFDKREILSKEELPEEENQVSRSLTICPNAILISNNDKNAKLSIIKRQILGIEKEAQIDLNFIRLECINQTNFGKQSPFEASEAPEVSEVAKVSKSFKGANKLDINYSEINI